MDKKVISILFLSTIAASSFTLGYSVAMLVSLQAHTSEMERLVSQVQRLNSTIQTLMDELSSLSSYVDELESQLGTRILGVYFSPNGGCEEQVINWIDRANHTIYVMIYIFTLDSIGDALIEAHNRGVEVLVVFEEEKISKYSEYWRLKEAGIPVRNDTNPRLMHNKVMIVDGLIVLTGSFNWSRSAEEENDENLVVIRSEYIASLYTEVFMRIWERSGG